MATFHFLQPLWLLALLPLALLLWRLWSGAADSAAWARLIDARLLAVLLVDGGGRRRRLPWLLLGLGWLLSVLALANPTFERAPLPVFRADAARVLVLDLSRSMLAADLTPTRLERARFKVADILARDPDGQAALVVFAGEAFVVAPLTDDAATITNLLAVLEPDLMPAAGSRVDLALTQALDLLNQAGARNGEVVLLADAPGDDRALAAARALRDAGHRLAVIGVGTAAGAPVPGVRRADGPVLARLDADAMGRLAVAGGGAFSPMTGNDEDLARVLRPRGDGGARLDDDPRLTERWKPLGPWLALPLLPLAALAFRRGWLVVLVVLLGLPLGAWAPSPVLAQTTLAPARAVADEAPEQGLATPAASPPPGPRWSDLWQRREQQAAAALDAGDFAEAERLSEDPARRGAALYRQGDYAAAAAAFASGDTATDHYNRGNALARAGDLEAALLAYDMAIARAPDFEDARFNRDLVEAALQDQRQQQQPEPEPEPQSQQGQGDAAEQPDQPSGQPSGPSPSAQDDTGEGASDGQPQEQSGESDGSQQAAGGEQSGDGAGDAGAGSPESAAGSSDPSPAAPADPQRADADDAGDAGVGDTAGSPSDAAQAADDWREQAAAAEAADGGQGVAPAAEAELAPEGVPDAEAAGSGGEGQPATVEEREARLAADQWLRRIPDDPGGLLRRKFLYQYQRRGGAAAELGVDDPW